MRLVICEKPSVAKSISAALGANERGDGYLSGGGYIVSWCFGHLIELAQADAYNESYGKWRYDDLPIIPEAWKYTVPKDKAAQLKVLAALMKRSDVDTVINACDAGREGELIFRLVYDYCKCKKPMQRLWISSMEETAIVDGFQKLRSGSDYDLLHKAALCRTHADWLVGINATRLFSVLYGATLNVGRVQTPTLALIVNREADISAFVKEPFYIPELDLGGFTASGEKQKDKTAAEAVRSACDGKTAVAVSVKKQEKGTAAPKLYDLTALQRDANKIYGYTAQQTLDYMQSLYEKKLATYPRTDSRFLTEDMAAGIPGLVDCVAKELSFMPSGTLSINASKVIDNSKVTDHHAIIPTATMPKADLSALPEGEGNILYLLAVRLICAVSPKYRYSETVVTVDCEGNAFSAKGKTVVDEGWKIYEQAFRNQLKQKNDDEGGKALPAIVEGQAFENIRASVREGFTSPPKHYTEDLLLSSMETAGKATFSQSENAEQEYMDDDVERKGLGTPATRASIIEKLVKGGFVERKARQLLPTDKGVNLIEVLPDAVKSPALTAEWENMLKQIERDEISDSKFMADIVAMTQGLVTEHSTPLEQYKNLFASASQGEAVGVCPRCGGSVRESAKGFFCESRSCGFALWKNNRFFTAKKKTLTKGIATALLKDGRAGMTGLYSEKTGKSYNATILLDDTGGKYVNFKLDFGKKEAKK